MSNVGALNGLVAVLSGPEYAAAANTLSTAGGDWAGITIGPFANVWVGERQNIPAHPAAIVEPSRFELRVPNHGGCDDNAHIFVVRIETRVTSEDGEMARKQCMAHLWAVRYVVRNFINTAATMWRARVIDAQYNGATPNPDGPMVASLDCTVEIIALESNDTVTE